MARTVAYRGRLHSGQSRHCGFDSWQQQEAFPPLQSQQTASEVHRNRAGAFSLGVNRSGRVTELTSN
jgi:hypothetical protein